MRTVGIDFIDDEHIVLLEMAESLKTAFCSKYDHSTIVEMIGKTDQFIRKHFDEEEAVLARLDKTGLELERHRQAHIALLARAEKLFGDSSKGNQEVASQFAELIEFWLADHIVNYDMRIRNLIESASALSRALPTMATTRLGSRLANGHAAA